MKVLLINGSPHKDGCTNLALEEIKKTLEQHNIETELIWIGTNPIGGCIGCNKCLKTNECFMDDIVNELIIKLKSVDGLIIGSPVHFSNPTGNLISLLDRLFYGRKKLFQGKAFAAITNARRGGTSTTFDVLNKYALISNMYVVGSTYWNQIHGTNKEEAKQDLEGLQTIRHLGENMAFLLKCIEKGKQENIELPKYEEPIKTNFIK